MCRIHYIKYIYNNPLNQPYWFNNDTNWATDATKVNKFIINKPIVTFVPTKSSTTADNVLTCGDKLSNKSLLQLLLSLKSAAFVKVISQKSFESLACVCLSKSPHLWRLITGNRILGSDHFYFTFYHSAFVCHTSLTHLRISFSFPISIAKDTSER